jgi:hypothetical protein
MLATAASLVTPPSAVALAAAVLASRRSDPTVQGRLIVKKSSMAARVAVLAPPPGAAALVPLSSVLEPPSSPWPPLALDRTPRQHSAVAPAAGLLAPAPGPNSGSTLLPQSPSPVLADQLLCCPSSPSSVEVVLEFSGSSTAPAVAFGACAAGGCRGDVRRPSFAKVVASTPVTQPGEGSKEDVSRRPHRSPTAGTARRLPPTVRSAPPAWLRGLCFRCLSRGHHARCCRDPIRCMTCLVLAMLLASAELCLMMSLQCFDVLLHRHSNRLHSPMFQPRLHLRCYPNQRSCATNPYGRCQVASL